ncbi:hypothetical protein Efla_007304 [Eimeria flavescens]
MSQLHRFTLLEEAEEEEERQEDGAGEEEADEEEPRGGEERLHALLDRLQPNSANAAGRSQPAAAPHTD